MCVHSHAATITLASEIPSDICEGSTFEVCLQINGILETNITVDILISDISTSGKRIIDNVDLR